MRKTYKNDKWSGSFSSETFQYVLERIKEGTNRRADKLRWTQMSLSLEHCDGGGVGEGWNQAERVSVCKNWSSHPPAAFQHRHLYGSYGPDWRNGSRWIPNSEILCGRGWGTPVLKTRGFIQNLHSIQMSQGYPPPMPVIRCFLEKPKASEQSPSQPDLQEASVRGSHPAPLSRKWNLPVDEFLHWNFYTEANINS